MTSDGGHLVGNPGAAVKLVEYVSYTCPHCAHFEVEADAPLRLSFIASGKGSMVCNPISAYRTAGKDQPDVYKNLAIVKPPIGVAGIRVGGARTMSYGIYSFSKSQDLGKQFLYDMNKESLRGMEASTGYNHPYLKAFQKKPMPVIGAEPKLELLQDYQDYVKFIGYPGPMTKKATAMYAKFIVPTMFAEVAKGKEPRAAMEEAEAKLRAV
jgi:hypothetical protein